ncbi:MAG: hypothetical protein EXQ67_01210 [Thermoleophilia bacterium]|nr:hypothetical protein [Thermoleophilia bacterium]
MSLAPIAILQAANGLGWVVLGAANLIVLYATDGLPLFGWWASFAIAVGVAIALAIASALSVRASLASAEPAVGVPLAAPSEAVGRCIGPVALAALILLVLALIPGAVEYRGLAAAMFLAIGLAYLPLAAWVRRFEEANGVIVTQPVNRYGLRTGAIRTLRLPR